MQAQISFSIGQRLTTELDEALKFHAEVGAPIRTVVGFFDLDGNRRSIELTRQPAMQSVLEAAANALGLMGIAF